MGRKKIEVEETIKLDDLIQEDKPEEEVDVINQDHPGWYDYVMSLFVAEELDDDGRPFIFGLRRVAAKLYGIPELAEPVNIIVGESKTTVFFRLVFNGMVVGGCADAGPENCKKFGEHAAAVAETRAEGRAYKRLLNIKVVTAEEVSDSQANSTAINLMNSAQAIAIEKVCKIAKINKEKFLQFIAEENKCDVNKITFKVATLAMTMLNSFAQNSKLIPESLK